MKTHRRLLLIFLLAGSLVSFIAETNLKYKRGNHNPSLSEVFHTNPTSNAGSVISKGLGKFQQKIERLILGWGN